MPKKKRVAKEFRLEKVKSLGDLKYRAGHDPKYAELLICGAHNLGGSASRDVDQCYRWLLTNASETGDESGVVDEVNFCIDIVEEKLEKKEHSRMVH